MARPIVNPGTLYWSGEHWINYLREPGAEVDNGMVSLWHTRYSAVGNGSVAYVYIPGDSGFQGICTDNQALADLIQAWMGGRGGLYEMALPTLAAEFTYAGDIRVNPSWIIQTEQDGIPSTVVATWTQVQPPVILDAPAPKFAEDRDVFSLLFFTDGASITLNDQPIQGKPYLRDIWRPSIGGDRSSCVFALAETFILLPGNE